MADFRLSKRSKKQAELQPEPADETSLMGHVGNAALGGLHTVGSILSLPGRVGYGALNALAGGEGGVGNLNPLDSRGGITPSGFLENMGLHPKNDPTSWGWDDGTRLAIDIAGDPLTWLSAGTLTPAGQAASRAGTLTRGLTNSIRTGERALVGLKNPLTGETLAHAGTGANVANTLENAAARTGLDRAAQAVGNSAPVRHARAMMDARFGGKLHPAIQRHAVETDEARRTAQNMLKRDVLAMATRQAGQQMTDPVHSEILRDILEGVPNQAATPAHHAIANDMRAMKDAWHARDQAMGIRTGDLVDDVVHFPRHLSAGVDVAANPGVELLSNRVRQRDDVYRNLGGTNEINRILRNPRVDAAIQQAQNLPFDQQVTRAHQVLQAEYPHLDADQLQEIAARVVGVPELRTQGLFGNHPLYDMHISGQAANNRQAAAQQLFRSVGDSLGNEGVPVGQFLEGAGFVPQVAAQHIANHAGVGIGDVLNSRIPADLAQELSTMTPGYRSPPAVQNAGGVISSLGSIWKSATLAHPASRVRDFLSALAQNTLTQQGNALGEASRVARAQPLARNYSNLREVADLMNRHGLTQDDAVRAILGAEAPAAHGVMADLGPGRVGAQLQDILDQIPGTQPRGLREVAGEAWRALRRGEHDRNGNPIGQGSVLNPLNVRGAFGRETTAFGPAAASNVVSQAGDQYTRHSSILSQMNRGFEPSVAGRNARASLVDYDPSTFTPFESKLTNIMPFYRFNSRALSHTARELASNPGGPLAQVVKQTDQHNSQDATLPDYLMDSTSIPLGEREDGTKRILSGLGLMHESSAKMLGQALGGDLRGLGYNIGSQLSPLIKTPIEMTTGQSLFREGEPTETLDPNLGRTASNILQGLGLRDESAGPVRYPGSEAAEQIVGMSPFGRLATTARSVTDTRKGAAEKLLNNLTGVRVSDISPDRQAQQIRKRIEKLAKATGAKTRSDVYFSAEELARLKQTDPAKYAQQAALKQLINDLKKKSKSKGERKSKLRLVGA